MISIAIQAAVDCQISTEYHQFETRIFDTFMTTLFCLPVHTVCHVPQMVRPLLASALCHEFSISLNHGLWGFARVLIFSKLVLRSPPRVSRKKCYLVGTLLWDQLQQWTSGTGIPDLWRLVCGEGLNVTLQPQEVACQLPMNWLNPMFGVPLGGLQRVAMAMPYGP